MYATKCENPKCTHDYCKRFIQYGDMTVCHICYYKVPFKKRSKAVETGKNQGLG